MDDRAWQQTTPLVDFVQSEPLEGEPISERTEVRLLYDDRYIYVGVICYDSDPSQINVSDTRRDASMSDMDSFQIIFDTYHDRQNGFIFGTNPAGAQYDAQVRNEGEQQTTGAGPPNIGGAGGAGNNAGGWTQCELERRLGRQGAHHRDGLDGGIQNSRCARCGTARRRSSGA